MKILKLIISASIVFLFAAVSIAGDRCFDISNNLISVKNIKEQSIGFVLNPRSGQGYYFIHNLGRKPLITLYMTGLFTNYEIISNIYTFNKDSFYIYLFNSSEGVTAQGTMTVVYY